MSNLLLDTKINNLNNISTVKQNNNTANIKMQPVQSDKFELSTNSNNQKENGSFFEIAGMLGMTAAVLGACTIGGVKIYEKFFDKLACGVKRGEINDAFYNFLKRIDPEGKIYRAKDDVLKINKDLTDENFLILKQLTKMKNSQLSVFYSKNSINNRFSSKDIIELIKNTNESNIQYLIKLAGKQKGNYNCDKQLSTDDIINVMNNINKDNEKAASKLIDKANTDEVKVLVDSLKKINKDNAEIYDLVLSTRQSGGVTELSFKDIHDLADLIKDTQKPKCAEFLINLKKQDGTGNYKYSVYDLKGDNIFESLLKDVEEEKVDIYKKLFEIKAVDKVGKVDIPHLLRSVNEDNIDLVEKILNKEYKSSSGTQYATFDSYRTIENVLKNTNKNNKDVISKIIDLCDSEHILPKGRFYSIAPDVCIENLAKKVNSNPKVLEEARNVFETGKIDNQTLTFKNLYNHLM